MTSARPSPASVVIVNVPVVAPAATVVESGSDIACGLTGLAVAPGANRPAIAERRERATDAGVLLESVTSVPPAGAGALSVTLPVADSPAITEDGSIVSAVTVMDPGEPLDPGDGVGVDGVSPPHEMATNAHANAVRLKCPANFTDRSVPKDTRRG